MTTDVLTLREYGEMFLELADDWDGEPPAILLGDVTGNVNVNAKDGFSKYGCIGYAQVCFEKNGVHTLGQGDLRFYGTMLLSQSDLAEEAQEALDKRRDDDTADS